MSDLSILTSTYLGDLGMVRFLVECGVVPCATSFYSALVEQDAVMVEYFVGTCLIAIPHSTVSYLHGQLDILAGSTHFASIRKSLKRLAAIIESITKIRIVAPTAEQELDHDECVICFQRKATHAFVHITATSGVNTMHRVCCEECASTHLSNSRLCPVCRSECSDIAVRVTCPKDKKCVHCLKEVATYAHRNLRHLGIMHQITCSACASSLNDLYRITGKFSCQHPLRNSKYRKMSIESRRVYT